MTETISDKPEAIAKPEAQAAPKPAPRSVAPARADAALRRPDRLGQVSGLLTGLAFNGVVVAALLLGPPGGMQAAEHGVAPVDAAQDHPASAIRPTKVRTFDVLPVAAPKPVAPITAGTFAPPSAAEAQKPIVIKAPRPAPAVVAPAATPIAEPPAVVAPATPTPPPAAPDAAPVQQTPDPAPTTWPETEVAAATAACSALLGPLKVTFDAKPAVRIGQCGTPAPIALRTIGADKIAVEPPALMNCAVAAGLHAWVSETLQPAAREVLGSPVVKLIGTSSYVCRNRNGQAQGPISEHAYANAFDISGVVLADGRTISVLDGWGPVKDGKAAKGPFNVAGVVPPMRRAPPPSPDMLQGLGGPKAKAAEPTAPAASSSTTATAPPTPASTFLKRIHDGACKTFTTVLGPDANAYHRNHLHFDLKPRKSQTICQ